MKHSLLYLLSLFCLAQAANLVRLADAPAFVIGFWRLTFAAAILIPFAFLRGDFRKLIELVRAHSSTLLGWISLSSLFFFFHLLTFFWAAQSTSIANCMVLFSLNPLFTSIISFFFMKEPFPKKLLFAYPLAFLGVTLLVFHHLKFDQNKVSGDIFALLSGLFYTFYILSCLKVRRQFSNLGFSALLYLLTALIFGIALLFSSAPAFGYPMITWAAIFGNVLLPTLMGHFLFTYLLQFLNVNWMSCGKLIEPALSSLTAYFLFQEQIQNNTLLAFACTGGAVFILLFQSKKV